jgi:hypothetical protein
VLLGEKAILKEYDSLKTKFERKRFSMIGSGSNNYASILGSFSEEPIAGQQPRQGRSKSQRGKQSFT